MRLNSSFRFDLSASVAFDKYKEAVVRDDVSTVPGRSEIIMEQWTQQFFK